MVHPNHKRHNLILNLQKKGIELKIKRTQIGENPNAIYGLLFKDIKTDVQEEVRII